MKLINIYWCFLFILSTNISYSQKIDFEVIKVDKGYELCFYNLDSSKVDLAFSSFNVLLNSPDLPKLVVYGIEDSSLVMINNTDLYIDFKYNNKHFEILGNEKLNIFLPEKYFVDSQLYKGLIFRYEGYVMIDREKKELNLRYVLPPPR